MHLTADVDQDGQHLGGGGGIDGKARTVGQILIKRKRPDGLAARCMFGERGSSNSSTDIEPSAVCIRTSKPFTVSVWSAGDFSLRDCPLSLMVASICFVINHRRKPLNCLKVHPIMSMECSAVVGGVAVMNKLTSDPVAKSQSQVALSKLGKPGGPFGNQENS